MSPAFLRDYRASNTMGRLIKARRAADRLTRALYHAGRSFGVDTPGSRESRTYGRIDAKRRRLARYAAELQIELSVLG